MIKKIIMQNLPSNQKHADLDTTVNNVFFDLRSIGQVMALYQVFDAFEDLNRTQDLVLFSNGTVAATKKGLVSYG